jgi:hypothetical protein
MSIHYSKINPRKLSLIRSGKPGNKILTEKENGIMFQTDPIQIIVKKIPDPKKPKNLILALDLTMDFREFMVKIQEFLEPKFKNFSPFLEKDLLVKTDDKTMGFTRDKQFLSLSKLQEGDSVILIISTTGTWTDSRSTNLVWKVKQLVKL